MKVLEKIRLDQKVVEKWMFSVSRATEEIVRETENARDIIRRESDYRGLCPSSKHLFQVAEKMISDAMIIASEISNHFGILRVPDETRESLATKIDRVVRVFYEPGTYGQLPVEIFGEDLRERFRAARDLLLSGTQLRLL